MTYIKIHILDKFLNLSFNLHPLTNLGQKKCYSLVLEDVYHPLPTNTCLLQICCKVINSVSAF